MLKVLVIDDEAPARSRMRRLMSRMADAEVVGEAASGIEALALIEELEPEVLLLDISMPGLDGMRLARMIRDQEPAPAVIFCTAWPDQALEAFECNAVDYLVKPVPVERLATALDKARRQVQVPEDAPATQDYLYSTVGGRKELIELGSVICLLAEDKYTTVFHAEGQAVIDDSLVELEQQFEDQLLRVHRNALVARDRIRGLEKVGKRGIAVMLDGTDQRPLVSRRRLPAVRRVLKEMQ